MDNAKLCNLDTFSGFDISRHAQQRMSERGISPDAISRVINFGRVAYVRGAMIFAVGRKEAERFKREGVDLSDLEGVQAVCSNSGTVMTVYRNHDFKGLRPRRKHFRGSYH